MKIFFLILTWTTSLLATESLTSFHIERQEGPSIQGYAYLPHSKESYPIVLALQSSTCESVLTFIHRFHKAAQETGVALIGIEKKGIYGLDFINEKEYAWGNTKEQRLEDLQALAQALRDGLFPQWDGRIILFGGSEGGRIAFHLANLIPETHAIMVFSAGGGMPNRQEVVLGAKNYLKIMGYPQFGISIMIPPFEQKLDEMLANPTPEQSYFGYAYLWWASHLNFPPILDAALALDCPILYAHGTHDELIPIESADAFAHTFKQAGKHNLTYLRLPGLSHDLMQQDLCTLIEYTEIWLKDILGLDLYK